MNTFLKASPNPESVEGLINALARQFGVDAAKEMVKDALEGEYFMNDTYQVIVRRPYSSNGMTHLSIKRLDREPIHDWRELQEIKNAILGPEIEAVELYPAESRVVDVANQYHLWAMPKDGYFSFGFPRRAVSDEIDMPNLPGAKQRERKHA